MRENKSSISTSLVATVQRGASVLHGPAMSNGKYSVEVKVTCPCLTAISRSTREHPHDECMRSIIEQRSGLLIAYDCGTDSRKDFTAADVTTEPPMNITQLYSDKTVPFGRKSLCCLLLFAICEGAFVPIFKSVQGFLLNYPISL